MNTSLVNRPHTLRAIAGGRAIKDDQVRQVLNPRTLDYAPSTSYNLLNLQRKNLFKLPFPQLRKMAFDLSPELDKTHWDFLRYCNPGYIIDADSDRAVNAATEFIDELSDIHGSFDNLLEQSFSNLFKSGRTIKELVLSEDARTPVDVFVADPDSIEFRKMDRGARGEVWVLGQMTKTGWEPLEDESIFYLAVDSDANNPYGKSMINPAIYDAISLLLIKQAVQRVLENQGYSRQDYSVDTERLLELLLVEDEELTAVEQDVNNSDLVNRFLEDVKQTLENKEVDSDYVHADLIGVNYAPGSLSGNALSSVDSFVHRLQQGVTVGGKSIPLLMADNESLAESQADRSLETYVDGTITPIQEREADQWSRILTLSNRVRGIRGNVNLMFQKRRVRDLKSIAETEKIQIENIIAKRDAGFITPQEAADEIELLHDPLII